MNIIAVLNGEQYANHGVMRALCKLKIDKLFLVEYRIDQSKDYENVYDKCTERYTSADCHTGIYTGKKEGDSVIPLDAEIIKKCEQYMPTALKIVERNMIYEISFEERFEHVCNQIKYWNTIIEKHNIQAFVCLDLPHGDFDYVIYMLCKIKNIPVVTKYFSPVMEYSYMLNDVTDHNSEVKQVYEDLTKQLCDIKTEDIELEKEFLEEYLKQTGEDDKKTPYYMTDKTRRDNFSEFAKSKGFFENISKEIKYIFNILTNSSDRYTQILEYKKYHAIKKYYENWNKHLKPIDMQKEKFIYFPLHMQPEATTTPIGGYFAWQQLAIEMLDYCLPDDVYIYVKENPKQGDISRTLDFPQKLASLKHVKLVHRDTDTFKLMQNSIATATITGTALWETLFKNKPVILFGDFIVQHAPSAFRVKDTSECKMAVEKIVSGQYNPTHRQLKIFLKAMQETCTFGFIDRVPLLKKYDYETTVSGIDNLFTQGFKKYLGADFFK